MSDAFADLWNQSVPSRPTQKLPLQQQQRRQQQQQPHPSQPRVDSFTLLASSAPSSRPITPSKPLAHPTSNGTPSDAFSDLLSGSLKPSVNTSTLTIAQRTAQAEKANRTIPQPKSPVAKNQPSLWDGLDALGTSNPLPPTSLPPPLDDWGWTTETTATSLPHKDQDNLLGLDDDDILGVLGKPVDAIPMTLDNSPPSSHRSPQLMPNHNPPSRTSSPPPHVVGQIVEMGFSPQDARVALAATDTGLDVQTALEILISNASTEHSSIAPAPTRTEPDPPPDPRRHRDRHPSPAPSNVSSQVQDQTDKILAQASGLGLSMLSKANALWASGKERALKAYEERTKPAVGASPRPKWMQGPEHEEVENKGESSKHSSRSRVPEPFSDEPQGYDEPKVYMSPFRRGPPPPPAPSSSSVSVAPSPLRVPSPAPRQFPLASTEALSASAKRKAEGNDKFKLGQYAEAETAYTIAIDALPSGHLLLILLHNNRAATRLKIGDYAGAADDAGQVIAITGPSFDSASDRIADVDDAAGGRVDLGDGFVKALRRRAEALEGRERWLEARKDWETLACCAWASGSTRSEGLRGIDRCRRVVAATDDGASLNHTQKTQTQPKPPPQATRRGPTPPSQALTNLRQATSALEAQENARYELKDAVDTRLVEWKAGKENNIRALIASLDTVLWPELGWVKVGMGELVSEKQVKIRYTKAIAKVHPDKLNANTTLEQQMIANGVFGTLNDAWNAFKP